MQNKRRYSNKITKTVLFTAFALLMAPTNPARADVTGGFNYGNWATGGSGASGTVDLNGQGSVQNSSGTATTASLGVGCGCGNGVVASDVSVASNTIEMTGSGTATSTTASTSAAGVGNGGGGKHH